LIKIRNSSNYIEMDERKVKEIVEEEFQRFVSKNMNDRNLSILDRLQALEDRMESIEEKLGK
jgi:tRNA(Phe) wybutosine-synthesizing methylase Tyw3